MSVRLQSIYSSLIVSLDLFDFFTVFRFVRDAVKWLLFLFKIFIVFMQLIFDVRNREKFIEILRSD